MPGVATDRQLQAFRDSLMQSLLVHDVAEKAELDAASRRPDATADVFREFARRLREGGELERARSAEVQAARMPRG